VPQTDQVLRRRQVKVRGVRIELGEIECVIVRLCPFVSAAAVCVRGGGDVQRLVAYVVPHTAVAAGAAAPVSLTAGVRDALRAELPADQIPHAIVVVPGLPVTQHGKLDRNYIDRLPLPAAALTDRAAADSDAAVAGSVLATQIAEVYSRVLQLPSMNPHDDFFDLGGSSLALVRLAHIISGQFQIGIAASALISRTTPLVRTRSCSCSHSSVDGVTGRPVLPW
jgi:hypothetical protein